MYLSTSNLHSSWGNWSYFCTLLKMVKIYFFLLKLFFCCCCFCFLHLLLQYGWLCQKCLKIAFNLNVHVNMKALFVSCCCTQVYEHWKYVLLAHIAKCFEALINWSNVTGWSCCSFLCVVVRFCCSTVWLGGVGLNIWNMLGLW